MQAEALELCMHLDNDKAYNSQKLLIFKTLARRKDRGKYDHDKAPKVFSGLLASVAKAYTTEFGSIGDRWDRQFSVIARKQAADHLAEQFLNWYRADWPQIKH